MAQSPFEHHDRLDALSDLWQAVLDLGHLDASVSCFHLSIVPKHLKTARALASASNDERMSLTAAKTSSVAPRPTTGHTRIRPHLMTRAMLSSGAPLAQEPLLLWCVSPRCSASRFDPASNFMYLLEVHVVRDELSAGSRALRARLSIPGANLRRIDINIVKRLTQLGLDRCFFRLPMVEEDRAMYFDVARAFVFGEGTEKRCLRLPSAFSASVFSHRSRHRL